MGKLAERAGLFTSNSPIEFNEEEPAVTRSATPTIINDLLDVREKLNKVHSEGYFENHYKEADRGLKEVLHTAAVNTIRQLGEPVNRLSERADNSEASRSITINIVLPK